MVLFMEKVLKTEFDNKQHNGFELHGLKHISVSQVNKFRSASDAWFAQYMMNKKFPIGVSAWQGLAVEAGITAGLFNDWEVDQCIDRAIDTFNKSLISKDIDNFAEVINKHHPIIKRMVETGYEQLRPFGKPTPPPKDEHQHKIEVPVQLEDKSRITNLGYLDFVYQGKHTIVDLKTSSRAPSGWNLSHGIQAAVYKESMRAKTGGENWEVKFLYVLTRQKDPFVWLTMDDPHYYMKVFKRTVNTMDRLLRVSEDKNEIKKFIVHDPDTFYWNDALGVAEEVFG
tara:strand:- start:6673 stop:7524 length:852 start_codon:yes stop_codon:yes gene_type:complete